MRNVSVPLATVRGQLASEACVFFTVAFCALGALGSACWALETLTERETTINRSNNTDTLPCPANIGLRKMRPPAALRHNAKKAQSKTPPPPGPNTVIL